MINMVEHQARKIHLTKNMRAHHVCTVETLAILKLNVDRAFFKKLWEEKEQPGNE